MPHVRICAGGGRKRSSLPRQFGGIGAYNNRDGRQIVMGSNGVQAVLVNLQCAGCAQARCRVLVKGVEVTQSTSCPLILKRASASRLSGEWSDDDYDVLADGVVVGRIMKAMAAPEGDARLWNAGPRPPRGPHVSSRGTWSQFNPPDVHSAGCLPTLLVQIQVLRPVNRRRGNASKRRGRC